MWCCSISPDGSLIASGSSDETVSCGIRKKALLQYTERPQRNRIKQENFEYTNAFRLFVATSLLMEILLFLGGQDGTIKMWTISGH